MQKFFCRRCPADISGIWCGLLAPDRWRHWGQTLTIYPLDYPIYNRILLVQALALSDVLNGRRLARLRDGELNAMDAAPLNVVRAVWTP